MKEANHVFVDDCVSYMKLYMQFKLYLLQVQIK